ncbi:alpha-(1,3)-fucosyltransferase 4-like [Parambassis ranga]|uniref:Fucosyltransferase n=1 Tax=Parambassis ranga TaxID=210632 RepID=A0A6P7JGI6_9TELE|nr:alpha-(1,3)-fucosyltransferase 4-like [Parambassis ranga]
MGAGAQWRPACRSTVAARRAARRTGLSRRETCCVRVLKRICSSVCVAAVGFTLLLGVCLLYLPEPFTLEPSVSLSEETGAVTLLIWTHPFGRYRKLPDCWELYQISECTLTDDAGSYPEADAVLIHHREIVTGEADLPQAPRPHAQKWIWMNYESPTHTPRLWRLEGVFNLTFSYRTDSDIFLPYGYLVPRTRTVSDVHNHFAQPLYGPSHSSLRPHRLVAWVISNWSESHARVAFYYQLRRYIQIDVFGRAGRTLPAGSGSVVQLVRRYLFYLALENSQHTDYITEKLWNAVRAGAVPVVLGPSRQNYERFLPPEAFIHVDDFPTVQELARYLLTLRRSPARMRRHLDWRGSYGLHQPAFWHEHYCTACRAVRRTRGRADVVRDLTGWFHS